MIRTGARAGVAAVATALGLALTAGCSDPTPTVTALPSASPGASPDAFAPGADGLGDRYFPMAGNGGYDVGNYDLDVTYDPATDKLDGVATITATATANLSRFNLDFSGLTVTGAQVNGAEARAVQQEGELVITPASGIGQGSRFVTKIIYGGVPAGFRDPQLGQIGFLSTTDGAIAIGEPEVAASWFPVNDHPRDKATYTTRISAPNALAALSNGVLTGKSPSPRAGFTTWTWAESSPMAPYLATMVVGDYRLQHSTWAGKPVVLAVHTSLPMTVDAQLATTPAIIDFLQSEFGPYPFDALGGIAIDDSRIRFALENQTRPIYSSAFFGRGDAASVIVHELAHQWYGDSVSVNEWNEVWLNEGFATYAEWLWQERQGTGTTAQSIFDQYYADAQSSLWGFAPGAPGKDRLFDQPVYTSGAMTLQALRVTVGDDAFFKILKSWAEEKKDGNGTTVEFVALAKRISGAQLDQLFNDWLYGTTRPPKPTR